MEQSLYSRSTILPSTSFQQTSPQQRRRDFTNPSPAMASAFLNFYDNNEFNSWTSPGFPRHLASPPPPPQLMNPPPPFHHQQFTPISAPLSPPPQSLPLPPPPPSHFSTAGGFQQPPQFQNGVISPLHSPGLGPVIPHMSSNLGGNTFTPQSYHNIPPPQQPSVGTRNQLPPPPNFAIPMPSASFSGNSMNGVLPMRDQPHHLSSYMTPPVSAPSSPSPPPPQNMINGSIPTQLPSLSPFTSITRKASTRQTSSKPMTPPPIAKSTVLPSRNEQNTNSNEITSSTPKAKLNPNASSFLPVIKSPAIVSSTPPPKRSATPPTKPRAHPFNPLSASFAPTSSTSSREDQSDRREKFNPNAPAFVPVSDSPPLPARSSPPPNAPKGPASLVPRTNPPPSSSSIPPYPKLPLSPPTGPKADRIKIPPRPNIGNIGLGIGMGAANEVRERGLPPTTPLGPKAMTSNAIPTGPRADRERPLSRGLSARYSGSSMDGYREKPVKEAPLVPIVALTRIPGIDKPVPTGPAAMLEGLPEAAKILDIPTAPAAMVAKMAEENASTNGSDDGSRGRPVFFSRSVSHTLGTKAVVQKWRQRVQRNHDQSNDSSRNTSKTRDVESPVSLVEFEVRLPVSSKPEVIPSLTEEPESYLEENIEKAVMEKVETVEEATEEPLVEKTVVVPEVVEQANDKSDDESVTVVDEEPQISVVELPKSDLIKSEKAPEPEAESKSEVIMSIVPTPSAPLVEQPVFTTAEEVLVETIPAVVTKIEEIELSVPAAIVAAPVSLPSIQIEADDSSRKEVNLDKDLDDANLSTAPRTPSPSPRLSEISMKKREEEGGEIVSMTIEDGVVIVPTRDTPSPTTAQMYRAMAKKKLVMKGKVENEVAIQAVHEEDDEKQTEKEKEKESVEVKPAAQRAVHPDPSSILNSRKSKKNPKNRRRTGQDKPTTSESPVPDVPVIEPVEEVISEEPIEAPVDKPCNDDTFDAPEGFLPKDGVPAKDTENDVGFTAESPLPVGHVTVEAEEEVVPIALDDKEEEPIVQSKPVEVEKKKEAAKATLEENDNEKEHDGGVRLDPTEDLPPLPEDENELAKITEIYSDSESLREEQDDDDNSTPMDDEPIIEIKPLEIVKRNTFVSEPAVITSKVVEEEEDEPVVIQKESPIEEEPVSAPVTPEPVLSDPIAQPIFIAQESPVVELLAELLVPAIERNTVEVVTETVNESAVLEPRHNGEVAVSINSVIEALTACKDLTSLSGTLATYSRSVKPGTQEERLFRELHHYAAIADPAKKKDNSDRASTRSKSSMRSVRSFFKRRAEAYPELLSSTTSRIKAILPPFLSMTAAPAINTIPTAGTITPTEVQKSAMVSTTAIKTQRPRLLPKMTMSLLHRSFSSKSRKDVVA